MSDSHERLINEIFKNEFLTPLNYQELTGGAVNIVYRIDTPTGSYVIRLNRESAAIYRKERWAMAQASAIGVRAPKVHAVGSHDTYDYMIMDWIAGTKGSDYKGDKEALYRQLGRSTRLINSIAVSGYGQDFTEYPVPEFTCSWPQAVDSEECYIFEGHVLAHLGILNAAQEKQVRQIMADYRAWVYPSCLSHGDMCLDNLIIDNAGQIHLIDWGNACGQPAPFFDFARVDGAGLDGGEAQAENMNAFVQGYGLSWTEWDEMKPLVQKLQLVTVLKAIVWAEAEKFKGLQDFIDHAKRLLAMDIL